MWPRAILLGLLITGAGCAVRPNSPAPASLPKTTPANSTSPEEDPELLAAISKARAGLDAFIERLEHPKPRESFAIEGEFDAPDGSHEYLWVDDPTYAAGIFSGTLRRSPVKVPGLNAGSKVTVSRADVTDWTIFTSGRSEGGYTVQLLLDREGQPR